MGSGVGRGGSERKRLTMKHYRHVELLKKTLQKQLKKFSKDNEKVGAQGVGWLGLWGGDWYRCLGVGVS